MLNVLIRFLLVQRIRVFATAAMVLGILVWIAVVSRPDAHSPDSIGAFQWMFLDESAVAELEIEIVEVSVNSESNSLFIPSESVMAVEGDYFVFVRDFEIPIAFLRVPVTIEAEHDLRVEVSEGLFPGDEVVASGVNALSSERGQIISNKVLKQILDAPFHRSEHSNTLSRFNVSSSVLFSNRIGRRNF